jgi:serine phosphatase RsbU (regulator of sigma subunit)/pSer/pThr/pTyr-binding forkhead associated (FHA) protein
MGPMPEARLEVHDSLGRRPVPIDKPVFTIGRRSGNDLHLMGSDVSRDHAEIAQVGDRFLVRDRGSRYGTFVNGTQVSEHPLAHGDRIQLGRTGGAELVFLLDDAPPERQPTSAVGDLRQVAALLEGLRALGSGRVLDEVLALVMDSTIELTGAERGFIMLANEGSELEMKLARARGHVTLPGTRFETSRKIPEEVFATGVQKIVNDLLDGDLANVHMGTVALGIRHVLCTPLRLVRYVDRADANAEQKRIGVLYLDSREKGTLTSRATLAALDTLATEAAVAIENARLYRDSMEKARIEQELRIASQIQQALLPQGRKRGGFFDAMGASVPCRAIGGDFFDYLDLSDGRFGFALGDVAGKGPPAALLTAVVQGIFAAHTFVSAEPKDTVSRVNVALIHRSIESRFATIFFGVLDKDGRLTYCNAGHNAPLLIGKGGVRRLEEGGLIVGMFEHATYEQETVQLDPGDVVIVFSDGVSEALSAANEEFGEQRLQALVDGHLNDSPDVTLEHVLDAVREFTRGAVQNDDVTALVVRYTGSNS